MPTKTSRCRRRKKRSAKLGEGRLQIGRDLDARLWKCGRGYRIPVIWLLACTAFGAHLGAQIEPTETSAARPDTTIADLRRFELGVNFADIRTDCINAIEQQCGLPSFGIGVGGSYNLNGHFAIDGDFAVTPTTGQVSTNQYGGRHAECLLGLRTEARAKHYGYFLKTQAGLLSWNHVITQVVYPPEGPFYFLFGDHGQFAGNLAAGFEYSPSPRIHVRAEIGDLLRASTVSSWTNNLQSMAGVYVGLGKPLAWKAPIYQPKTAHRFFDAGNLTLMTASVLGMTADSISTQRFIARGQVEGDPFARPLVKYGWSGQIAAEGLEINAVVWGMYGLHRIHQHWIERIAPAGVAAAHGFFAYANDRVSANAKPAP